MGRVVHLGVKTFTNGEILTAPILNASMWSFATYKATTDGVTIGSGGTITTNYCRPGRGDLVFFNGHIVFGTSPSFSTVIAVTLPTSANTSDFDRVRRGARGGPVPPGCSGTRWSGASTRPGACSGRAGTTAPSPTSVAGERGV